jgi:hypothetical protein
MSAYFKNYVWKNGIPFGIQPLNHDLNGESYKIISDPYRKRISIEKYRDSAFEGIVYDSALVNFRHLRNPEHAAWQKSHEKGLHFIRDQDDRILFIEAYQFTNHLCRECHVHSPHGIALSCQKMFYKNMNDIFDGVVLYDINNHIVMFKLYEFDEKSKQFTTLIKEEWDMEKNSLPTCM